jgi:polyphosphate glucokinase
VSGEVLAVDVGATSIRTGHFDRHGTMVAARTRRRTPYPCHPERLITLITERAQRHGVERVSVGFPGEVHDGVVIEGANLTRPGGLATPFNVELAEQWRNFPLRDELATATQCHTTVHNDAAMAALGASHGAGTELVVTLGTGCGLALCRDGELVRVRDVGNEMLKASASYDEVLGEIGRRQGESQWLVHVIAAVSALAEEFEATTIHLAGGNSRRISPHHFGSRSSDVIIAREDVALRGAWRASYA